MNRIIKLKSEMVLSFAYFVLKYFAFLFCVFLMCQEEAKLCARFFSIKRVSLHTSLGLGN